MEWVPGVFAKTMKLQASTSQITIGLCSKSTEKPLTAASRISPPAIDLSA
jgi:hypothetical protein